MPHDVTHSPFMDNDGSLYALSFNIFNQSVSMELFRGFISVSRQHKALFCSVENTVAFYSESYEFCWLAFSSCSFYSSECSRQNLRSICSKLFILQLKELNHHNAEKLNPTHSKSATRVTGSWVVFPPFLIYIFPGSSQGFLGSLSFPTSKNRGLSY